MQSTYRSYQINLHILLQNGKNGGFLRIWRRNVGIVPLLLRTLRFVCRIQFKVVTGVGKMYCESLNIRQRNWRSRLPKLSERLHVCFEYGTLRPRAKGLIDVSVHAPWRDIPDQVRGCATEGVYE